MDKLLRVAHKYAMRDVIAIRVEVLAVGEHASVSERTRRQGGRSVNSKITTNRTVFVLNALS